MSTHNFSFALTTWKSINLAELQKTLDAQGIEVVENQKESVVGRKALADRTKEWKKIPEDDKLNAVKVLLKAYQTEIDSLTKRSKSAENAFLNVYKLLAEAPDPYPLLEAAVDQTAQISEAHSLSSQISALKDENAELKRKLAELPTLEKEKKKADAKVQQLEQKMDDMIQEKVVQKENELNATYDEKMRNYEEREQDLTRQLSLSKIQLRDLRMSVESSQAKLLDQTQRIDQEVISKLAEMDILVSDLERSNSRVLTVERRNELLRAEIESIKSSGGTNDRIKSLETQIQTLESETDKLSRSLDQQKEVMREAEVGWERKVRGLEGVGRDKDEEIEKLRERLRECVDYDEVKRELDIMKYVEFGGLDEDEELLLTQSHSHTNNPPHINGTHQHRHTNSLGLSLPSPNPHSKMREGRDGRDGRETLEVLLASKNKRLLDELTKFRIDYTELETSLHKTQSELLTTQTELTNARLLNERLENDLLEMDKHQTKPGLEGVPSGSGSGNGRGGGGGGEGGYEVDAAAEVESMLAGLDLGTRKGSALASDSPARTTPIPFAPSADTSILPIVTSQRDRFRQRNAELEDELRKQFQIISELRAEIKTLQADNLKLYEKVRYMQSYREESSRRHAMGTLDPLPSGSSGGGGLGGGRAGGDDMSKYRTRYEEAMNPFEAFRGREAARAYSNLNPMERGVLVLTRAVLGNRRARNAFIFYALALHLLVMFTTYECTTSSGTQVVKQPIHI